MGLVQHDDGVLGEVVVHQALPQQHPICHVLDDGLWAGAVLEANGVANLRGGEGREERRDRRLRSNRLRDKDNKKN